MFNKGQGKTIPQTYYIRFEVDFYLFSEIEVCLIFVVVALTYNIEKKILHYIF